MRNQRITIENSRIVRIESNQANRHPADINLRRFTVMPGWIDTHVHLDWHFGEDGKITRQPNQKLEELALYDAENTWLTLQGGFLVMEAGTVYRNSVTLPAFLR